MVNCATWVVIRVIRHSAATCRACHFGSCRIPARAASSVRRWVSCWGYVTTGLSRPVYRRDSSAVSTATLKRQGGAAWFHDGPAAGQS